MKQQVIRSGPRPAAMVFQRLDRARDAVEIADGDGVFLFEFPFECRMKPRAPSTGPPAHDRNGGLEFFTIDFYVG
jgi:hypothetical protein